MPYDIRLHAVGCFAVFLLLHPGEIMRIAKIERHLDSTLRLLEGLHNMCDYSLMAFPNRLAVSGEVLVVHRFQTNSLGLISPSAEAASSDGKPQPAGLWAAILGYFKDHSTKPVVAVCIPPGSKLVLHDIPATLRDTMQVGPVEEVTFTQLSANAYAYRDAVRFSNGHELALQHLIVGQRVKVLSIASEESPSAPETPDFHEHAIRR